MDPQILLEQIELIKKHAKFVIDTFGPLTEFDFGLNRESVEWVEGFIERQRAREDFDMEKAGSYIEVLGSFLGESMIANAGGEWGVSETHGLGISFGEGSFCFPFNKVKKAFRDGLEGGDSILWFYDLNVDLISDSGLWEGPSSD